MTCGFAFRYAVCIKVFYVKYIHPSQHTTLEQRCMDCFNILTSYQRPYNVVLTSCVGWDGCCYHTLCSTVLCNGWDFFCEYIKKSNESINHLESLYWHTHTHTPHARTKFNIIFQSKINSGAPRIIGLSKSDKSNFCILTIRTVQSITYDFLCEWEEKNKNLFWWFYLTDSQESRDSKHL